MTVPADNAAATERRHAELRALCADGHAIDLAQAALLLSAERDPNLKLDFYRDFLGRLVEAAEAAVGKATPPQALREVLGEQFGFRGDGDTYEDLQNADFARVLDRRKGLPIALGILYVHVARALGFACVGLNFPGHFVIRLDHGSERSIIDPFHGGRLREVADLRNLYRELRGPEAQVEPQHFSPVSDADVLLRLQNNIKLRLVQARAIDKALAIVDGMLLFVPEEAALWREAALLGAHLGNYRAAIGALEEYLRREANSRARHQGAALLQQLRAKLN